MADKPSIVELRTNIPLTFSRLTACYYSKPKPENLAKYPDLPDSFKLVGQMDGTSVAVYLSAQYEGELSPWVTRTGDTDRFGNPAFGVSSPSPLTILKTEDGKRKYITISPDLGPAPVKHHGGMTGSSATPPLNAGKPPQQAPSAPKPQPTGQVSDLEGWAVLRATYAMCRDIAVATWEGVKVNGEPVGFSDSALVAATATLLIDCQKRGLKAFPTPPKPGPLSEMPKALADDPDSELPF